MRTRSRPGSGREACPWWRAGRTSRCCRTRPPGTSTPSSSARPRAPFPGTPLFRRLEAEGRILTTDWARYNGRADVVFQPRGMSREELLAGFRWANRRFYSLASIARRLRSSPVGLWWTLPLNLAYRGRWKR